MSNSQAYPVPPEDLRWRVVGNRNADAFLRSGPLAVSFFDKLIRMVDGNGLRGLSRILDWGCGCGRLARALPQLTDATVFGADIDAEAIAWCTDNLPFGTFEHASEYPPLSFADGFFDLVYATSVLTHLDEEHQFSWLGELNRIIRPGGYAILTYKSHDHFLTIEDRTRRDEINSELRDKGFIYSKAPVWKDVFPEYYQDAYHSFSYVQANWSRYFEVLSICPPQVLSQYAVLLQKPRS